MALSAGAHPRRKTKNAYDPDFLYDFPSKELFHDREDDFNLHEQSAPVPRSPSPIKHSTRPAKAKSTTAHSVSPLPLSTKDTGPSTLSFDQQLQLIKLQKEKLELELKDLTISWLDRPPENTQVDFPPHDTVGIAEPWRNKRNINWP